MLFLTPLEVLEDSWGNVRVLLGTWGYNFLRLSWSHFQMVWEKETRIGYFINIMKLCMWFCCQRAILPSVMKNWAIFFTFHFTHYPSYQKDKTVVLEKLHGKVTNTVKSIIKGHKASSYWDTFLFTIFVSMSRPRFIFAVSMWSIFSFSSSFSLWLIM